MTSETLTSRSYKLRLFTPDENASLDLVRTTVATSLATAKALQYLITARAGLDERSLAADGEDLDSATLRHRRRVLFGCWFTAEAPSDENRPWRTTSSEMAAAVPGLWRDDVADILGARLREGSVWVDRRSAWAALGKRVPDCAGLRDDLLGRFLSGKNLWGIASDGVERDLDCIQIAGSFIADRLGSGKKSAFDVIADHYRRAADWAERATESPPKSLDALELSFCSFLGVASMDEAHALVSRPAVPGFGNFISWRNRGTPPTAEELKSSATLLLKHAEGCLAKIAMKGPTRWSTHFANDVLSVLHQGYDREAFTGNDRQFLSVALDHAGRQLCMQHARLRHSLSLRDASATEAGSIEEIARDHLNLCRSLEQRMDLEYQADDYCIGRRAIAGYDAVMDAWIGTLSEKERLDALYAYREQAVADGELTGDMRLFAALALDTYRDLWADKKGRPHKAPPLKRYQSAREAEMDMRHYLHPTVALPHPYQSPVWIDYGASRPSVEFASLSHGRLEKLAKRSSRLSAQISAMSKKKKAAKTADALDVAQASHQATEAEIAWIQSGHALRLAVLGDVDSSANLRWANRRFVRDFGIDAPSSTSSKIPVPARRTRTAMAAAGTPARFQGRVDHIMDQAWPARLMANRNDLQRFRVALEGIGADPFNPWTWGGEIARLASHISWYLPIAVRLPIVGPWSHIADKAGLNPDPTRWPYAAENKSRNGRSRLGLCRIPGLRVMGGALGARNAASVAVVEAVPNKVVTKACKDARISPPSPADLFARVVSPKDKTVTTYRRIADDHLPDGSPHPAPWARIDRRAHIAVPGDPNSSAPERKLMQDERDLLDRIGASIGLGPVPLSGPVTAVQTALALHARDALQRLNRLALIAYRLGLDDAQERAKGWQDLISVAHDASDVHRSLVEHLWQMHVRDDIPAPLPDRRTVSRSVFNEVRQQYRSDIAALDGRVTAPRRKSLAKDLSQAWSETLGEPGSSEDLASGWFRIIRDIRDWIAPVGDGRGPAKGLLRRQMGGLSLGRIGAMQQAYRLLRAWRDRAQPDFGERRTGRWDNSEYARYLRNDLDRIRRERERYIASNLVQAAIPSVDELSGIATVGHDRVTMRHPEQWRPAHALVTRDVSGMRTSLDRTRQSNAGIARMSAAGIDTVVDQLSELHGLHRRSVPAAWTERLNALTLQPGIRATTIHRADELKRGFFAKRLRFLKAKSEKDHESFDPDTLNGEDRALWYAMLAANEHGIPATGIILPARSGELLISSNGHGGLDIIDSDHNAAVATALEILVDPDSEVRWTRAAFNKKGWVPTTVGSPWLNDHQPPAQIESKRPIANAWRIPYAGGPFVESGPFWSAAERHIIDMLITRIQNVRKPSKRSPG